MNKKLICITGPDGSGKTTLINALVSQLESVYVANIWDLMTSENKGLPFKSKQAIDDFLCDLTPDSRLLFLAHALKYSMDKAFESDREIILVDSYYYKYFATELALGANKKLVNSVQASFAKPDLVIYLKLDPQIASQRKPKLSRYECGLAATPSIESFNDFQQKVQQEWGKYIAANWLSIDSHIAPDLALYQALKHINKWA